MPDTRSCREKNRTENQQKIEESHFRKCREDAGMGNQVFNPFLPEDVYIPDSEPHVFGDRIYLFGSHDQEDGDSFCLLDYEG